jgi:small GTP-binding protein
MNNNSRDQKKAQAPDTCQLIIVGDSIVGKTSILVQYTENQFNENIISTVGIDYYIKTEIINGNPVQIKIWDTAGQERYQSQTNSFFKNAEGVILVYDVTNPETFDNLKNWLNNINSNTKETNLKKIIIGNKIDLKREVKKEDAENFAKEQKVGYFETSAKNNKNIYDTIKNLAEQVVTSPEYQLRKKQKEDNIKLGSNNNAGNQEQKDKKCCK